MRRLKRSTLQSIIVAIICLVVVIGAFGTAYFIYVKQLKENYQNEIDTAYKQLNDNQHYAYVAKRNIKAGEDISKENVDYKLIFSSVPENAYISEEDLGKISLLDIEESVPVQKSMITDHKISDDLREEEFNVFYLNSNLKEGEFVDIRILFPNGEDYVVLSKKAVKNLALADGNCFMWLNAEEILTISSAIVDAYLNEGSKLYTVKYIEPLIQEASIVTYNPNQEVINLIKSDPNVVQRAAHNLSIEMRSLLDDRLKNFYLNYNGEVTWKENKVYEDTSSFETEDDSTEYESEVEGFYVE